jgi:hypothetical protein
LVLRDLKEVLLLVGILGHDRRVLHRWMLTASLAAASLAQARVGSADDGSVALAGPRLG